MMAGEVDLDVLLKAMSPVLLEPEYIFCTLPTAPLSQHTHLNPIAYFVEKEGTTLIIDKLTADKAHIDYDTVLKCITLQMHSSLEAVGLTAAVASKLAENDISANVVAAYYHDHVFVPTSKAPHAVQLLAEFGQPSPN